MRVLAAAVVLVTACAGAPPPADWQLNAAQSLQIFEQYYLSGDARADAEFARARSELARTGREDLVARAELVRCAVRAASLEFDECPAFEALRAGARAEELAYADYLSGRGKRPAGPDALSRLVAAGVLLKSGAGTPTLLEEAVEIASAQGWRRPLLAWLGALEKRARESGDDQSAARVRRRINLISG